MSEKIHRQWQLKRENGIKYWIEIKDFRKQVHRAHRMGDIFSDKFKIGESMFRIEISSQDDGFLGVFLENLNDWRVRCSYTFRAGEEKCGPCSKYFSAQNREDSCLGDREFFSLDKIDRKRILKNDGRLVLEIDVQLLEEEVLASSSRKTGGQKKDGQKLQKELSSVRAQLSKMEAERDRIWSRTKEEIDSVKSETLDVVAEVKALLQEETAAR